MAVFNLAIRRSAQLGRRRQREERGAVLERLLKEDARAFYQRYGVDVIGGRQDSTLPKELPGAGFGGQAEAGVGEEAGHQVV